MAGGITSLLQKSAIPQNLTELFWEREGQRYGNPLDAPTQDARGGIPVAVRKRAQHASNADK
jgi:hypothetical protein